MGELFKELVAFDREGGVHTILGGGVGAYSAQLELGLRGCVAKLRTCGAGTPEQ
jgi:hypothetical protein